eukprot:1972368-Pyramimonas_sp.AAC.1
MRTSSCPSMTSVAPCRPVIPTQWLKGAECRFYSGWLGPSGSACIRIAHAATLTASGARARTKSEALCAPWVGVLRRHVRVRWRDG